MLKRTADILGKLWRYLLALAARPGRAPRWLWCIAVRRVHAGELLHLAPFETWLRGLGIETVLDAGAHTGEFASAIKTLLPRARVYAFEPQPDCHRKLTRRLRRMGGCEAFCLALGDRSGEATLLRSGFSKASSLLSMGELHRKAFPWTAETRPVQVPVARLDELGERLELRPKVLLKLDVQGYELALLQGAEGLLGQIDHVLVEVSLEPLYDGEASFAEIHGFLSERGFRYRGSLDQLPSPLDGRVLQQDAFFGRE